jgi:hypothetical protein
MNMIYKGGVHVAQGTYWDIKKGSPIDIGQDSILPGTAEKTYIKASVTTMLMAAPMLGLLFAIFLPFIGIAMAVSMLARRVFGESADVLIRSLSFGWKPIEAYLSGKKKKEEDRKNK